MKKKYAIFTVIIFILLVTTFTYFNTLKQNNIYKENIENNQTKITKGISMNLEQTAGAGDYKTVTQSGWPTEGYKFNTELSRCENGSELSWDDTNKKVIVSGNLSDKCYVYFDIWIPTIADYCTSGTDLATCVKNFGDQGVDVSNIYIHDSSLTNGAGDNSYRYAGPSESVNNFACFGTNESPCPTDNLYRIIGVIDGKVKLIKYDYITIKEIGKNGAYATTQDDLGNDEFYKGENKTLSLIGAYFWNYTETSGGINTWSTSSLNKTNLNTNYINNIGTEWSNKIATTTWKVGGNAETNIINVVPMVAYANEIKNPNAINSNDNATTYDAKVGLMYVSDYSFAACPEAWTLMINSYDNAIALSSNWMYMGLYEWTISRDSSSNYISFNIDKTGAVMRSGCGFNYAIRVTFNLNSSVTYVSGTGTQSDPIRIN